ncbi:MAG: PaaI family thioesterase [Deltaproteobacteria bacterium]|nr:PaaI family thioesterase [Deltaproteobacteria bacterium]
MGQEISKERQEYLMKEYSKGFIAFCGFRPIKIGQGLMESRVDLREEHRQQDGFVHAGMMATMADHTAGYAAFTMVAENLRILTVEFKINFLRPAYGQSLACRARVIKPGRKVLICQAEVYDVRKNEEVMVAIALATMAAVPDKDIDNNPEP